MKNINVALVRLIQFVIFVFFTFMVIAYFAVMVLIPLDALVMISDLLGLVGINTFVGAMLGLPVVGYLCKVGYEIPALRAIIVDTGMDLVKTGKAKIDAFSVIAESVK
jgi:hypothetical protein